MRVKRQWRNGASGVAGVVFAMLMVGCDTDSGYDDPLMRTFDALCVTTRLEEDIFHHQVRLFEDAAEVAGDVLRMLSPNNIAGYSLTDPEGDPLIAVMSLTKSGDAESRGCSISSQSVGFEAAAALVATYFPVEMSEQFNQGASRFSVFQGSLAGYPNTIGHRRTGRRGCDDRLHLRVARYVDCRGKARFLGGSKRPLLRGIRPKAQVGLTARQPHPAGPFCRDGRCFERRP